MILDLAEYWPHSSCSSTSSIKAQGEVGQEQLQFYPAIWRKHRGPEATTPLSFTDSSEDGFVLRSPLVGISPTDVAQSQAFLASQTRHPVRMIIFEIRYWNPSYIDPNWCKPQVISQGFFSLEVGIKKPIPPRESPPRAILKPATRPTAQVVEGSQHLQQICDLVYKSWHFKRSFCDPAHTKIDLYITCYELPQGMIGQRTVVWRFDDDDDDDVAGAEFNGWDLGQETWGRLSEAGKARVSKLVHSLAKEDQRKQADFVKQLEVGDSLGVWVRVRDGLRVIIIEGVSMHVFWAAS